MRARMCSGPPAMSRWISPAWTGCISTPPFVAKLQTPGGVVYFLHDHRGKPIASPARGAVVRDRRGQCRLGEPLRGDPRPVRASPVRPVTPDAPVPHQHRGQPLLRPLAVGQQRAAAHQAARPADGAAAARTTPSTGYRTSSTPTCATTTNTAPPPARRSSAASPAPPPGHPPRSLSTSSSPAAAASPAPWPCSLKRSTPPRPPCPATPTPSPATSPPDPAF